MVSSKKLIKYTLLLEKDLIKPWQRYYNSHTEVKLFVFFYICCIKQIRVKCFSYVEYFLHFPFSMKNNVIFISLKTDSEH